MIKQFVDKQDSKFTVQEIKDIWDYANKKYLIKADMTFNDMLNGMSKDLGLTSKQIRDALSQLEGTKEIIDEFERKLNQKAQAVKNAKDWIKTANYPMIIKFLKLTTLWTWIKKWDKKK
jgi:hypothetical protein